MKQDNKLSLFEGKPIRKIWQDEQWFFSIIDIIEILTESPTPRKYWDKVKRKLKEEGINETSPIWRQFKLMASDDKLRLTDCANTEGVLRIIMSVPSPKAQYEVTNPSGKRWMAQFLTEPKSADVKAKRVLKALEVLERHYHIRVEKEKGKE